MASARPVPSEGKVEVIFGNRSMGCTLRVPAANTASSAQEPAPVGWLTVGHLAFDGIALQVASHAMLAKCACERFWCCKPRMACGSDS